jgi:hypothetical protein
MQAARAMLPLAHVVAQLAFSNVVMAIWQGPEHHYRVDRKGMITAVQRLHKLGKEG